jgi:hypothetical protein
MARLPLLFGLFLSFSLSFMVFMLSLMAKVTVYTLMVRTLTIFFVFGVLGVILGSILEILLAPVAVSKEQALVREEMALDDPKIEQELGDLITHEKAPQPPKTAANAEAEMKPAVFPRMTVEGGKVVGRGDSVAIS